MAIAKVIRAREGDTLCQMAADNGFKDCAKVRAENAGAEFVTTRELRPGDQVNIPEVTQKVETGQTEILHRFRRPGRPVASIRFVHGTPTLPVEQDPTLRVLNVSRYATDQAGDPDGTAAWVNEAVRTFEANADKDPDTFKVEVKDIRTTLTDLQVELEALRPIYDPSDARGRRILRHEAFPGAERARRSLGTPAGNQLLASRQGTTKRFRSCYLRLVTDDADKNNIVGPQAAGSFAPQPGHAGRPLQTLLVTDMTDEGDPQVEILDQLVKASYTIDRCPGAGPAQCRVTTRAPIGTDRRRMRIALHVMRQTPGGAPVVPLRDAERRIRRWFRRNYAQSSIGPRIVLSREQDPLENMITVSDAPPNGGANAGGANASGVDGAGAASRLGFRINAPGQPSQVIGPINPAAGQTPIQTANRLAALVQAPYSARVTLNPRRFNDAGRSADIVIREASGRFVTIDQLVSTDSAQVLQIGDINPLPNPQQSWDGRNFLVGSLHQRVMLKNYDTGDDRIDIFVVNTTNTGNRGEAMMSGHQVTAAGGDATAFASRETRFSLFVIQSTMNAGDNDPLVLAHEIGHIAGELGHAQAAPLQLMAAQVTGNEDVGASKRIRNGNVGYDITTGNFNMGDRVRSEGRGLLEAW